MNVCILAIGLLGDDPIACQNAAKYLLKGNSISTLKGVTNLNPNGDETMANNESNTVKTDEGFDQFLQDATLALREMWEERGGEKIGHHEAMALNDAIQLFFEDKRSS